MPENPFYNVAAAIRFTGALNIPVLEQTFNAIVHRHETLRTTFALIEGELTQVIAASLQLSMTTIDLQTIPLEKREAIVQQRAIAESQAPFNLTTGPLIRVTLLQLEATDYVLLLTLHHIVADGWSIGVLLRELSALYTAFCAGKPSPLPALPIQYADFAHWQRDYLQGAVLESQLAYWRQQLADLPTLELPTDRSRPPIPSYQGATAQLTLSADLTAALEALSHQEGVTLFMTLLAAFQSLMMRYTGQDDVVVGTPIANRNRSDIEGLIGFFVNSLVLRTDLSGEPTFRNLLKRVQENALAAYAHQDLPFEKLVEALKPTRDLSRNPLFQVVFALQNTPIAALELPEVTLAPLDIEAGTTRFDLEFHCFQHQGHLHCTAIYSTDLFDATTIERLLGHFQTLLEGIVANPDQHITALPLLTAPERQQLLIDWNATQADYFCNTCFHHRFEAQVAQTPNAIAIVFQDQQLTYSELNQRANQLAHHLQQLGVGPEVLVGLCVDRSPELAIGILGIWKAGGAYVPLDPDYPRDRLTFMLTDAQVALLVTQQTYLAQFASHAIPTLCLDQDDTTVPKSLSNPISTVTPNHLADVIYTSGSTGKPKGVLVEHRGLSNLVDAQRQTFHLQASDRVLQFASLSFDASLFELVMALGNGAALYLAPKAALLPGANLLRFLQDNAITHATLPPAVLAVLPSANLPALHTLIAAGEACSANVVNRWSQNRQCFNAYGPTETTIWATIARLKKGEPMTIGRPIANTQIYLLDAYGQPVPIGVVGELYIGGTGVARGYLNRAELTAERFVGHGGWGAEVVAGAGEEGETRGHGDTEIRSRRTQNSKLRSQEPKHNSKTSPPDTVRLSAHVEARHPTPDTRLYKTGDRARYRADGSLEFLGRMDSQVKIRGVRIELGEIETVFLQHDGVQAAVVTVREDTPGAKRIVAYVVANEKQPIKTADLRDYARSQLPSHFIPSAFVWLKTLPLTPNGKVNHAALPRPDQPDRSTDPSFVAPQTAIEATLVQIWAELLQLESISIRANFFDLGGDSLLAARLMERVQQQFKQELPLSTLFLAPTIEQLARTLVADQMPLPWSPLVPLQPNGAKPPFFCVHPIFGVVFPYCQLAQQLGSDQPFYGLQPFGLDGNQTPFDRLETIAAHYIQAIRTVQPQGPYFLGGWSFGGLVAFEMAQQLQQAGQTVALLALLDTPAPIAANQPSLWSSLTFLIKTAVRSLVPFAIDYLALLTSSNESWKTRLQRVAMTHLLPQESRLRLLDELTLRPMLRVFAANSHAAKRYVSHVYPSPITLFRTADSVGLRHDTTLGWQTLTRAEVAVHQMPGNHFSMLRQPQVEVLASQLERCMETARLEHGMD